MCESGQSHLYGKFFLLASPKSQLTLVQSDDKGFNEVMSGFSVSSLRERIVKAFKID